MKRRDVLSLLGAAASIRPLAARAEQPAEKMPRIGVLTSDLHLFGRSGW